MQFQSVDEILAATAALGRAEGDTFLPSGGPVDGALIDRLAHTGALGATPEIKGTARWIIRSVAAAKGIRPASIHDLYMAMGRGEASGFTVPAMNIRVMSYYTARAAFRAAKAMDAGAIIFEIARSEIGYTEQRPHEYAAMITAAALREGFDGPLFIQGDHVQVNAKKYHSPDREKEFDTLRGSSARRLRPGFYNIDIDTSTLVDLDKATLDEQQAVNCDLAADFTEFCRRHEPEGVTVSVGGEIGEVGGKNSDVHELHAFMRGYNAQLRKRGEHVGISKISVQTGTAHGGFVGADGKPRMDVQIDLEALHELSSVARSGLRPRRRGAARRVHAPAISLRCIPEGRRVRDPPRDRLPEHGVRPPAVPGGVEGRDVRMAAGQRRRGAEAERYRAAVPLQGAQEGHRALQGAALDDGRRREGGVGAVAGGALRLPDEAAERGRHGRCREAVRDGSGHPLQP